MSNAKISSKTCFKCGVTQPRTQFYKHPDMGDGLLGKCKTCTKADVSAHRLANLDRIREYDSKRASLPHRRRMALELQRLRRKADRRKEMCHNKVLRAVSKGALERLPCSICGSGKSVAHHESYDRPLDVIWYCQAHHVARHKQMAIEGIEP
jgi:hypothetical protein